MPLLSKIPALQGIAAFVAALVMTACGKPSVIRLPYSASNPVIYDNDAVTDVYTDEYLMALASLGEIQLKGMLSSSSIAPENRWVSESDAESNVNERQKVVAAARASGFRNIPDPVRGPKGQLNRPASGQIQDTRPNGSEGSWLIVREARKASAELPLVVVMGGPLTAAADAYLLDPSIADKVIVAWLCIRNNDMGQYNGWADGWAAYIVLQKLRLVQFGDVRAPLVTKAQLLTLPESPLRDYMYQSYPPGGQPHSDLDGDAPPAVSLMRSDYAQKIKSVTFGDWKTEDNHEVPVFRRDVRDLSLRAFFRLFEVQERGNTLVVTETDQSVATTEWWRAVRKALSP